MFQPFLFQVTQLLVSSEIPLSLKSNIYFRDTVGCTFVVMRSPTLRKTPLKQNFNYKIK